jgi:hypothetical protein
MRHGRRETCSARLAMTARSASGQPRSSVKYQAAMIRDQLAESAGWTTVGIARVLTEKRARAIAAATGG